MDAHVELERGRVGAVDAFAKRKPEAIVWKKWRMRHVGQHHDLAPLCVLSFQCLVARHEECLDVRLHDSEYGREAGGQFGVRGVAIRVAQAHASNQLRTRASEREYVW